MINYKAYSRRKPEHGVCLACGRKTWVLDGICGRCRKDKLRPPPWPPGEAMRRRLLADMEQREEVVREVARVFEPLRPGWCSPFWERVVLSYWRDVRKKELEELRQLEQ